jgi:beta-N-acetylhexosaminidase
MSPEARVGQLFMVTFEGTDTGELSAIYDLIVEEHIGGVLLRPENGNIINEGNTPVQVASLSNSLQQLAVLATQAPPTPSDGQDTVTFPPLVPLFVAVEQSGNGVPYTAIVSGTTPLPSPMAIGATWNPAHAETVGTIVGQELSALGINMLLGPSLDVLSSPSPGSAADLGVQSFGGDPYWVGQMGAAYIRGVHAGSGGAVAVVGGRFPGLGAADRPLSEEVSTIQKSLEQLKQIELAPFFAVAGAEDLLARPDGLLVSHIRFRGFQGNIRSTTRPISFDAQALQQLMSLPELGVWREGGGITVADELGVRAVRRFYDPTEQQFNGLRIAHDAFLAGNDLLVLSRFSLTEDWESQTANMRSTIAFFREKYATDPTFQTWVDESVLRILRLKGELYTSFLPSAIRVDEQSASSNVGQQREQIAPIARDAATLLSPPSSDLRPAPPAADEWIVIFTDDRLASPCDGCVAQYSIPPNALANTMVTFYGPQATNQVNPARLSRFSFSQLSSYLTAPPPAVEEAGTPTPPQGVAQALERADWVIFNMLTLESEPSPSFVVRRFLAEQVDLLRGKQVVVLAFGAPYYLDTTEIAKLSMYLCLYSQIEPFIETATRALFDEFPFSGASPVTIPGIDYYLIVQTQPDPLQTIELFVGPPVEEMPEGTPQAPLQFNLGDTLQLRTSVILDRNGHPVPDGTPVEFGFAYPQEGLEYTVQKTTRGGVATTDEGELVLDRPGHLQIAVRAEPVARSVRLELDIPGESPPSDLTPTPPPTTPEPSSPLPTPVPTPETDVTPDEEPVAEPTRPQDMVTLQQLSQALASAFAVAVLGYALVVRNRRNAGLALRVSLLSTAGGLIGFIALALRLPGSSWWLDNTTSWASGAIALTGAAISLALVSLYNSITYNE